MIHASSSQDYRAFLSREYERRSAHNPVYSLRAFARDLSIAPSRLSEVFNKKSGLSRKIAEKLAFTMGLNTYEKEIFCTLVESEHARSRVKKNLAKQKLEKFQSDMKFEDLSLETFRVISDWYHLAIVELTYLKNFKSNIAWISKKLGISQTQTKIAIKRLIKLGLLAYDKQGNLQAKNEFNASPDGIPSEAIKKAHHQMLEKAISAIYTQSVQERDFSVMMLSINKRKLNEAKKWIKEFRRKFCKKISQSQNRDDLYCLSIQFFNLLTKEIEQ